MKIEIRNWGLYDAQLPGNPTLEVGDTKELKYGWKVTLRAEKQLVVSLRDSSGRYLVQFIITQATKHKAQTVLWVYEADKVIHQHYEKVDSPNGVLNCTLDCSVEGVTVHTAEIDEFLDRYNIEKVVNASPNKSYYGDVEITTDGKIVEVREVKGYPLSKMQKVRGASYTLVQDGSSRVIYTHRPVYDIKL